MATVEELLKATQETETIPQERDSDVSTIGSIFAGVGNSKRFIFIRCKYLWFN